MSDRRSQRFYIITGGTMVHIAPHFSLCAPAYGKVGHLLESNLARTLVGVDDEHLVLVRTRMALGDQDPSKREKLLYEAAGIQHLETNDDLSKLVDYLIAQENTRCIVMAAAVCDWKPTDITYMANASGPAICEFGKDQPRLKTDPGFPPGFSRDLCMGLKPAEKILRKIRQKRKDIFLVAFKATAGLQANETYAAGLKMLKQSSANLVFANDVQKHSNMVVTPEEFPYSCDTRKEAIKLLAEMIVARTNLTFVRTSMVDDAPADLNALHRDEAIPGNFAPVLNHLIEHGAYKPFLGKTAGHFGCKIIKPADYAYHRISSVRKVNHNLVFDQGMARIFPSEDDTIKAGGAGKPSVGEHTQRQIHERLGNAVHSVVHFHCPMTGGTLTVPVAPQKEFECGSVQCGHNTASNMKEIAPNIWAVHLLGHGPNIAFHKDVPSETVIGVIQQFWDLGRKSGGPVE